MCLNKKANCSEKIGQTKFNLLAGESEAKFRNIRTVYESKTDVFDGFGADDDVAWWPTEEISSLAAKFPLLRPPCCLLFSLHARVYLTFPLFETYGYGRLCDRCDYMETAFFAIVCDCLPSAIRDLRSSAIIWKPALRIFHLLQLTLKCSLYSEKKYGKNYFPDKSWPIFYVIDTKITFAVHDVCVLEIYKPW